MANDITVTGVYCEICEFVDDEDRALDDFPPGYECGSCGQTFTRDESADGDSNRCPICNRFGAKLVDHVCPDCGENLSYGELPNQDAIIATGTIVIEPEPAVTTTYVRNYAKEVDLLAIAKELAARGIACKPDYHFMDYVNGIPPYVLKVCAGPPRNSDRGVDLDWMDDNVRITADGVVYSTTIPVRLDDQTLRDLMIIRAAVNAAIDLVEDRTSGDG